LAGRLGRFAPFLFRSRTFSTVSKIDNAGNGDATSWARRRAGVHALREGQKVGLDTQTDPRSGHDNRPDLAAAPNGSIP
jgi:hypothetical protein